MDDEIGDSLIVPHSEGTRNRWPKVLKHAVCRSYRCWLRLPRRISPRPAASLDLLASLLVPEVGRRNEALEAAQGGGAVVGWLGLPRRPTNLAMSLNNLAAFLSGGGGSRMKALVAACEAGEANIVGWLTSPRPPPT